MRKILIACDAFKDALSSFAVCKAIASGLHAADPGLNTYVFPMADGGEGTAEVLAWHLGGTKQTVA
ncbi:MAG: glycerate kinase, partial [Saprospiraceae bacterium]|nr:glycerate kinase [Saprospiraceae bacterium]